MKKLFLALLLSWLGMFLTGSILTDSLFSDSDFLTTSNSANASDPIKPNNLTKTNHSTESENLAKINHSPKTEIKKSTKTNRSEETEKAVSQQEFPLQTDEIRIRDPFVFTDREKSLYYLYAQAGNRQGSNFQGVEVYSSPDLKRWSRPVPVLVLPETTKVKMVWAPEVHQYRASYYLFVTLTFDDKVKTPAPVDKNWAPMFRRGTWIFKSDSPTGPFLPLKTESHTPTEWMALDGTLWVENNIPYLVFCHEWVQIIDGTIDYVPLKSDLSDINGSPIKILSASDAPGALSGEKQGKVTDGPFLYQSSKSQTLYMIWSTFLEQGKDYAVLATRSESGKIEGPWSASVPVYTQHGGHGMIFESLDGKLYLSLHQPNSGAPERFRFMELTDNGNSLQLAK